LIIRSVLVPAIMQLFGKQAWWMPGWLSRILPNLAVEPHESQTPADGPKPAVVTESE
jgi:RND superfamily putative drug exporter